MQQGLNSTTIYILTEYKSDRTQSVLDVLKWRYALPADNPAIFNILKVSPQISQLILALNFAIVCFCSNVKWCELYVSIYGIHLYVAVVFWHTQIKYQIIKLKVSKKLRNTLTFVINFCCVVAKIIVYTWCASVFNISACRHFVLKCMPSV